MSRFFFSSEILFTSPLVGKAVVNRLLIHIRSAEELWLALQRFRWIKSFTMGFFTEPGMTQVNP